MKKDGFRRGISAGTILMISLTLLVLAGFAWLFPKLSGQKSITSGTKQIAMLLTENLSLPELKLEEIPIFAPHTEAPATPQPSQAAYVMAPTATPAPTAAPTPALAAVVTVQATAEPTPAPEVRTLSITAAGDIAIRTGVRQSAYISSAKTYDTVPLMQYLNANADLSIATLHNTLLDSENFTDVNTSPSFLDMIRASGFNTLMLGTENILDAGVNGLNETVSTVRAKGFTAVGANRNEAEHDTRLIMTVNGIQVAILHYQATLSKVGKSKTSQAEQLYAVRMLDMETAKADIGKAREEGARVVIVSLHWGSANGTEPTKEQRTQAQQLADAGADLILGSHSGTVQTVEYLTGTGTDGTKHPTLVAYSLGSLLTDSREGPNIAGMLLHVSLAYDPGKDTLIFEHVSATPTYIWRYQENDKYRYRVVPSNGQAPDGMSTSQQEVMGRALTRVEKALSGTPAALTK